MKTLLDTRAIGDRLAPPPTVTHATDGTITLSFADPNQPWTQAYFYKVGDDRRYLRLYDHWPRGTTGWRARISARKRKKYDRAREVAAVRYGTQVWALKYVGGRIGLIC